MAPLDITRSSKSILKESLFNTLSTEVVKSCFVEFFAGSGSIGIEALSRGAQFALFFEKNRDSYVILESNLATICEEGSYRAIFGDTFELYKESLKTIKMPSIAYFDPPFNCRTDMQNIYEKCFAMIENLDSKIFKIVILEHISALVIPQKIGEFSCVKSKKFGKSALSYFRS